MKAIPLSTSIHEQLVAVRLYRDDLERVIGLLRDAGLVVAITDGSFEYDSLDEFQKAKGNSPRHLRIAGKASGSYDSVVVSKADQFWYVESSGDKHHALARELEALLKRRQSAVEHLPLHWMFQGAILLVLFGTLIRLRSPSVSATFMGVGALAFLVTIVLTAYWRLYPGALLKYRHESGFLARHRDSIALLILGALIGAVVPHLFGLLAGGSRAVAP